MFETTDVHDYTKIKREAAVRWFKGWFTGNNDTIIEAGQNTLLKASLTATSTGLVYTNFPGEKTVQDINLEIALSDSVSRKDFWTSNTKDSCLNMLKHLIRLREDYEPPTSELTETIDRGTYTIDKIKITSGNNVPVTGLLFKPKNLTSKAPATVYLHGSGKSKYADVGSIIEEFYVDSGEIVFAIDALNYYDLPDLVNAISPRNVSFQKSLDASLKNIGVTGGKLSPSFSANILSYDVIDISSGIITIMGSLNDKFATYTGNGTFDVSSQGETVELMVTAEDGVTKRTYTVTIPRYVSLQTIDNEQVKIFLGQNYPNPFNDVSTFNYTIQKQGKVNVDIFSIDGRKTVSMINEEKKPGNYEAAIMAENFKTGGVLLSIGG